MSRPLAASMYRAAPGSWKRMAPATPATDEDGAAACAQLLLVGARTGLPFADIDLLFADGTELAQRSGNVDARARLLAAYGGHSMLARCDFETARPSVEEARRLAEQGGDGLLLLA